MTSFSRNLHENIVLLSGRTGKIFTELSSGDTLGVLYVECSRTQKTDKIPILISAASVKWLKKQLKTNTLNMSMFMVIKGYLSTYEDVATNSIKMQVVVANIMAINKTQGENNVST